MIEAVGGESGVASFENLQTLLAGKELAVLDKVKEDAQLKGSVSWVLYGGLMAVAIIPGEGDVISLMGKIAVDLANADEIKGLTLAKSIFTSHGVYKRLSEAMKHIVNTARNSGSYARVLAKALYGNGTKYAGITTSASKLSRILDILGNIALIGDIADGLFFISSTMFAEDIACYDIYQDGSGVAVIQPHTEVDTTPPSLVSSDPPDGATNVPAIKRSISFTFSEPMKTSYNWHVEGFCGPCGPCDDSTWSHSWSADQKTFTVVYGYDFNTCNPAGIGTITWSLNSSGPGFQDLAGNTLPTTTGSFTFSSPSPQAYSAHFPDGYYAHLLVHDYAHSATSIIVTGHGITGTASMSYNIYGDGIWWLVPNPFLGISTPTSPETYNFTITTSSGTITASRTISGYVEEFATNLSPSGTVSGPVTFSWNGIPDKPNARIGYELNYIIEVYEDTWYNRIWKSSFIVCSSPCYVPYAATWPGEVVLPLKSGHTYYYYIIVNIGDAPGWEGNKSFSQGSFTYK